MEVAELDSGASKSSLSDNSKEEVIEKVESAKGNEANKTDTNHEPEDVASKSVEIEDCSDNSHDEDISETKIELSVENAIADQINKIAIENEKNIGELSVPVAKIDDSDSKDDTTNVTSIVKNPNTNSGAYDDSPTKHENTSEITSKQEKVLPIKTTNMEENLNPIQIETSVKENSDIVLNKKASRDVENISKITQPIKLSSQHSKTDSEEHSIEIPSRDYTGIKSEAQQKERQDNIHNTLKEIISDIDRVIELEEVQAQQQNKCLQHQQKLDQHDVFDASSLVRQIQDQNNVSHMQSPLTVQQSPNIKASLAPQPTIASKSVTSEESRSDTGYVRKNECYEVEENDGFRMARSTKTIVQENRNPMFMTQKEQRSMSLPSWKNNITQESPSAISKKTNLQKIFTPATDTEEILPKNRKLYASSAFYSSNLHPTVEDQVALARRISNSLSDISNHQSKGQSMYVNRKKRSVKWVHEGSGQGQPETQEYNEESKENEYDSKKYYNDKVPLKLVMNPHGQVRDLSSVCEPLSETGLLSPDRCAELVIALNATKGRGAELFAKRRRKAEKWIVDENNAGTVSQSGLIDPYRQSHKPTSPASMVPAYSDVGIHRVQLNMQQDKIQDKYSQPNLKIINSPWEAALQTGSASNAFEEVNKHSGQHLQYGQYQHVPHSLTLTPLQEQVSKIPHQKISTYSCQRDLAYKPNIPQGWKAPAVVLPKALSTIDQINAIDKVSKSGDVSKAAVIYQHLPDNDEDEIIYLMTEKKQQVTKQQNDDVCKNYIQNHESTFEDLETILKGIENCKMIEEQQTQLFLPDDNMHNTNSIQNDDAKNNTNYTKLPVKDLILTFEQQVEAETLAAENLIIVKPVGKKPWTLSSQHEQYQPILGERDGKEETTSFEIVDQKKNSLISETEQFRNCKELYVPKEIPLESYAPPPEASHYFPNSGFPVNQHASAFAAPAVNSLYSSFPTTKLSTDSYNQSQSSQLFSRTQPQKQQQSISNLYQQQQTSSGHSTPVNFNPSPLAYKKLAKFQRTDPTTSTNQAPYLRQLNATPPSNFSDHIKTQHKSFSKPEEPSLNWTQLFPSQEVKNYSFGNTIPENSTYSMVSAPSVDLSHCQNFNVSARGWIGSRKYEPYRALTVTPKPVGNLRYTDF